MTKLILAFLVLIVGLALISSITSSVIDVTQKTGVNNETVDISAARLNSGACPMEINGTYPLLVVNVPADWRSQGGCPLTVFSMWDVWNVQATVTTDYTFFGDNGTLYLQNTTAFVWDNCSAAGVVAPNATLVAYVSSNALPIVPTTYAPIVNRANPITIAIVMGTIKVKAPFFLTSSLRGFTFAFIFLHLLFLE